jgi:hypothetical protein
VPFAKEALFGANMYLQKEIIRLSLTPKMVENLEIILKNIENR